MYFLFTAFAIRDLLVIPEYYYAIPESEDGDEMQIENDGTHKSGTRYKNPRRAAACSLFILLMGNGAGILVFCRKNIK